VTLHTAAILTWATVIPVRSQWFQITCNLFHSNTVYTSAVQYMFPSNVGMLFLSHKVANGYVHKSQLQNVASTIT